MATAADADAAGWLASQCGQDVEVVGARTEWETLYAQADGTMRLDYSAAAVRTRLAGEWVSVDNSIVSVPGGLAVAAPVTGMTFSDGSGDAPLVQMERDGHELSFDVPFGLPTPTVSGAQLTYPQVLPGVDLIVTVNPDATGFGEVLRIDSPEAAANPLLDQLAFPVAVSEDLDVVGLRGGFVARTSTGEAVFSSPTPAMWDSAAADLSAIWGVLGASTGLLAKAAEPGGDTTAAVAADEPAGDRAVAPLGGEAVAWMPAVVVGDAVTIVPDAEMLADPQTVWPVYIDPGVTGSLNQWTAVRDAYGPAYGFNPDEGVGLCSRPSSTTCSTTFRSRLLWQFAGLSSIGALEPNQVISATFAAVGTHSWDCSPRPVTLYRVADFSSGTSWPGGDLWDPLSTQVVAHKVGCADQPVRWIEFSATSAAQAVAGANTTMLSLGLYADESTMANWKRYRYDATLSVVYNRPPSAPTSVVTTTPSTACGGRPIISSATPTLRAVLADPDGGNVQGHFDIYNAATGALVWSPALTTAKASGSAHTITVPAGQLAHGGIYQWRVNGQDPYGLTSAYVPCEFIIDLVAPVTPGVAPVAGQPAVYVEDAWAGGVGKTGQFRFSNGGSGDVATYKYSFDNTALTESAPAAAPTVSFAPPTVGTHTLRVQSVDTAGWGSPVRLYRFNVTFAGTSALWMLDEASGTVAVDTGPGGNLRPLTVSASTTRVDGALAELEINPADRALYFDAIGESAATAGPVVSTLDSFTIMAVVRLDNLSGTSTAVSQNGVAVSGFELGQRVDAACPGGMTSCWGFWMNPTDSSTPGTRVAALSTVPVRAGSWVHLTGVHDAGSDTLRIYVCELGTRDEPANPPQPIASAAVTFRSTWNAVGALAVGRGLSAGAAARPWPGAVSEIKVLNGVVDAAQVATACTPVFPDAP